MGTQSILGDGDGGIARIRGENREEEEGMTFGVCGMRRRVGRQAAGGWCVSVSCVVCVGERGGSCGGGVRSGGVVEWWSGGVVE